ncbi:MAG: GH92 family glycosyl hydrolase [Kiritimatiellae bacterium]|nr:GH92 family glycosyl hydrolase [Kiritimatiellia bacterium]
MKRICLWLAALTAGWMACADDVHAVWRIGTKDGTGNEFALAPDGFGKFLEADFGWDDTFYLIGHAVAEKNFPYVLPSVGDAWAGSNGGAGRRTQKMNILFDVASLGGQTPWTLVIDFADAHRSAPPLVMVTVNGKARKFTLPKGGGDASIMKGDFSKAVPFTVRIALEEGEIRMGANEVMITAIEGSWAIFDDVRLEGPADAKLNLTHGGAYVRKVYAGDYLIPGTRTQPLLVDVEHLSGTPVLRVEVDGKTVLSQTVDAGAYSFEAPMPAVEAATESAYRVLVDDRVVREGRVTRTPQRDAGVAGYVDTRMGTAHSRWMLAPGPWTPFSMVKLSPDNEGEPGRGLWQGGYDPSIESVATFSHIHEWTMAGLGTMPATGPLKTKPGSDSGVAGRADGYRSAIDKTSEVCKIGYYAVSLTDYGIYAELTATDRCGCQRYTYPAGAKPRVMIDLLTPTEYAYSIVACEMRQTGPRRIEGFSKQETPRVWSHDADQFYTLFFVLEFDRDIVNFGGWEKGALWTGRERAAQNPGDFGAYVEFAPGTDGTVVQVRSGISFVDLTGAANNLKREVEEPFGWDFGKVRAANEKVWNDLLGRVTITTADRREKKRFYTNLYRSFCRNTFSDVDGRWNDPLGQIRQLGDPDARALGCDAFWNTFWNLNQVWNLIGPEWSARWVKSQMALYEAGGWLGKGPAGMRYVPVMVAEHEIPQMVSAWQMGVRPCDPEKLMAAFKKMQTTPAQKVGRGFAGNRDLRAYLEHHYVPNGKGLFSNSMEYSYDDWTVGQFAKAIGRMDDYAVFNDRGGWWRNAVNPETGYCQLRDDKGEWKADFDPFNGHGYTEGNGWQLTYFVPQDVPGLVARIGRDRFLERLKWGFEKSCPLRYNAPGEDFARYPVVHGNQQSMHFAFLFSWAGEPWESQKWVRSILERYYGYGDATAWLGDEDQGQMSAWLVMAALGLFQTDGGCRADPVYEIASPLYEEAVVDLGGRFGRGGKFVIKAHGTSRVNKYVQKAAFNGKPLNTFLVDAREVLKGGTLELWMGPRPNKSWGIEESTK